MLHVLPVNDEREHELGERCWCEPEVQWLDPDTGRPWENPVASPLVIHSSADCREVAERVTGEQAWPGAQWMTVES